MRTNRDQTWTNAASIIILQEKCTTVIILTVNCCVAKAALLETFFFSLDRHKVTATPCCGIVCVSDIAVVVVQWSHTSNYVPLAVIPSLLKKTRATLNQCALAPLGAIGRGTGIISSSVAPSCFSAWSSGVCGYGRVVLVPELVSIISCKKFFCRHRESAVCAFFYDSET